MKSYVYFALVILGITIVIIGSYQCFLVCDHKDIIQQRYAEPTLIIHVNDTKAKKDTAKRNIVIITDSVTLKHQLDIYNKRVDALEKAVKNQREENNTIVDRSSAWLSFWLAIFALVLAIPGAYSIIQIRSNTQKTTEAIKNIETRAQKKEDEINCVTNNSRIILSESQITSLTSCINHVLEPQIYRRDPDARNLLNQYLNILRTEIKRFVTHISQAQEFTQQDIHCFLLIFLELETIFSRVSLLETTLEGNIALHGYQETLRNARKFIANTNTHETVSIRSHLIRVQEQTARMVELFTTRNQH